VRRVVVACWTPRTVRGLPGKTLTLGDGTSATTGLGGCVPLHGPARSVRFCVDGSALASSTVVPA
jgi:hypothetical protein